MGVDITILKLNMYNIIYFKVVVALKMIVRAIYVMISQKRSPKRFIYGSFRYLIRV